MIKKIKKWFSDRKTNKMWAEYLKTQDPEKVREAIAKYPEVFEKDDHILTKFLSNN